MIQQLKASYNKNKEKKTGKIMPKFIEVKKIDMKCKEKYKNCSTNQNKASIEIFQNYEISEAFERTKEGLTFVFIIYDR